MKECPLCKHQSISRTKLILQELSIPFVKAICENCNSHIGVKTDHFFTDIWVEIVFFIFIIASISLVLNTWLGLVIFVVWSSVRVYIKTNGKLECYQSNL
tara:strand:+ start:584 stop:883 length:300 start_codon:yes stop_codon:yes gene_type:complete